VLTYKEFNEFLLTYLSPEQCEQIHKAFILAESAHSTQKRYSGELYITHPLEVAKILSTFRLDYETIQAGLLHDVLEDTPVTKEELADVFGEKVAYLVDGVSKLKQIKFPSRAHEQAENLRKMMFAVAHDIRVLVIKLADRLHNMRTINSVPFEKKNRKAMETLEIYAPIAYRLGMHCIKKEFEDLGFKILFPYRAAVLEAAIMHKRQQQNQLIEEIHSTVTQSLRIYGVATHRFLVRQKNPYTVYRKMQRDHVKFIDIKNLIGFRLLVYTMQDCYRILGILHSLFKPMMRKFKDYIAIPKANGYQSLHTTVIVKDHITMEFQIRTVQMHKMSENGIVSHSMHQSDFSMKNQQHQRAQQWINNIIELQKNSHSSLEFIELMKIDLDPDEVYVFDEKGEIWTLPKGSTPIDLAYARSGQDGGHCQGCFINGLFLPLSTPLQSGQTIKLLFSPQAVPNPGWLTFAITGKARSYIRNWLRHQQHQHAIVLGKRLLVKAFGEDDASVDHLLNVLSIESFEALGVLNREDLLSSIGLGKRLAASVAQIINQQYVSENKGLLPLRINGHEGMVLEYAQCCYPIAGDAIVGLMSSGVGLIVHRENCTYLQKHGVHESLLPLTWDDESSNIMFHTKIELQLDNHIGVLALIANSLSESQVNIVTITAKATLDPQLHDLIVVIAVRDRDHLAHILKKLRKISFVRKIKRS
jgi:guanosine-3',5'-bis(diphosphate) 3'-pyrophosphohydrolase